MKINNNVLLTLILLIISSCSSTKTSYYSINDIKTCPTDVKNVEFLVNPPRRSYFVLGKININGNGFSNHDDLINDAKKKAAQLGGDFILLENSGTETKTVYNPGYSTYQSNGNAQISGTQNLIYGSANEGASGYSIGPSVSTYYFPWDIFLVGVYTPSTLGIYYDDNGPICRFHLNSDAELAGLMIGDQVIGLDGIDINDACLAQHLMTIQPGEKIVVSVSRYGYRQDYTITAMLN